MLIRCLPRHPIREHQITDESVYLSRRDVLKGIGLVGTGALLTPLAHARPWFAQGPAPATKPTPLTFTQPDAYRSDEPLTPRAKVISHKNFYEFGAEKDAPQHNARHFASSPWTLTVDGLVASPYTLDHDDLLSLFPLEERIYRLRCVEAWSMVIPWIGFGLRHLIKRAHPLGSARYVAFQTLHDPEQMPGQRRSAFHAGIDFPYVEGLRLDEAMHPLTLMSVGLYGKTLPPQNGAPIRLVVPWKYGFKSIKSIVRITLTEHQPPTTWQQYAPKEYGFYANVNPEVDHPRWSQASERRLTSGGLFTRNRIPTLPFNGYDDVASLYSRLDLRRFF